MSSSTSPINHVIGRDSGIYIYRVDTEDGEPIELPWTPRLFPITLSRDYSRLWKVLFKSTV